MSVLLRKSGLFSTMVDGQAVVYDSASNQTHCINPQAVRVWHLCDGRHDRDAIVHALTAAGADAPVADIPDLVDASLDRFAELGLLETAPRLDRRTLGAAAVKGMAAGLVLSVMVPTRAAAASIDCSSLDEDQCLAASACSWVGVCVPADG
ncbi:MAG: hypothetical protein B7X99_20970 [Rhizobiales bacterium 17-65-6]|nr:MAG: hypothetical protein B7X99_20970 [Rhizobiales bacterium 17-65-6]